MYSERVRCGKRTYFIDVKPTHSGKDFFLTISESRKVGDKFEKHKIYLYKEDFSKFAEALDRSMNAVSEQLQKIGGDGQADFPADESLLENKSDGEMIADDIRDLTVDDREDF